MTLSSHFSSLSFLFLPLLTLSSSTDLFEKGVATPLGSHKDDRRKPRVRRPSFRSQRKSAVGLDPREELMLYGQPFQDYDPDDETAPAALMFGNDLLSAAPSVTSISGSNSVSGLSPRGEAGHAFLIDDDEIEPPIHDDSQESGIVIMNPMFESNDPEEEAVDNDVDNAVDNEQRDRDRADADAADDVPVDPATILIHHTPLSAIEDTLRKPAGHVGGHVPLASIMFEQMPRKKSRASSSVAADEFMAQLAARKKRGDDVTDDVMDENDENIFATDDHVDDLLPPPGDAMRVHLTREGFPIEVTCATTFLMTRFLFGTPSGLFQLDKTGKLTKLIGGIGFKQLVPVYELGILVALCTGTLKGGEERKGKDKGK